MIECYVCKRMVAEPISAQTFWCEYCGKYKITDEVVSFKIIAKHLKDIYRQVPAVADPAPGVMLAVFPADRFHVSSLLYCCE